MVEHPNVALVRKGMDAFNSGDTTGMAEYIAEHAVRQQRQRTWTHARARMRTAWGWRLARSMARA